MEWISQELASPFEVERLTQEAVMLARSIGATVTSSARCEDSGGAPAWRAVICTGSRDFCELWRERRA